jgi:hypothetical protein
MDRSEFEPGAYVRHPGQPDWGLGQVQSALGPRVTVMFENAGKVVVDTDVVPLERAELGERSPS